MKVFLDQQLLLSCLKTVSRAVSGQNTLPVLGNILLRAEGKMLHFSATNLELSLKTSCEAAVKNEGAITVPAKILTSYVSLLKDDSEVELSVTPDVGLQVKAGKSKTKIKGIAADEFPNIADVMGGTSIHMPAEAMRTAVHQVAFAAQENASRPILGGVLFQGNGTDLAVVATDSYRLSEKKITVDALAAPVNCIIPVRALLEADRLGAKAENITLMVTENQAMFTVGATQLTTRLIEGTYPDYKQIVPKEHITKAVLNRGELELAVRRVSIFAKQNNQHMKFDLNTDGTIRVYTDQTEIGEDQSTLKGIVKGKSNIMALNADYVLGLLSALNDDEIVFEMQEKMNPAVFRPKADDSFLHLIMPLKA